VAAPEPPSPFAPTHYLLLETTNICIVKKPDENFGVNSIKCEKSVVSWWIRIGCKPETTAITITMSNLELAVLAKCVLDAGANSQCLLGQSTLADHFRQATSMLLLATATDSVILPRSFETRSRTSGVKSHAKLNEQWSSKPSNSGGTSGVSKVKAFVSLECPS
jgi:hypothetical protein